MKKLLIILISLLLLTSCSNASNSTIKTSEEDIIDYSLSTQENIIKDYDEELGVGINQNNFPDEEFIKYIKKNVDIDDNNYLSNEEIENVKSIDIDNNNKIENLNGIELFTNLEELICYECKNLSYINIDKLENLKVLKLCYIPITNINLSNNNKIEVLFIFDTNIEELSICSLSNNIDVGINSHIVNMSIDVSNCPFFVNNIYGTIMNNKTTTIPISYENLDKDNYVNVIINNTIIKHCEFECDYYLGQGENNVKDSAYNTRDEAFDYGFNGNKWFEIVTHPYKDGTECTLKDCWTNPESCTYQYEVIVYDEQPF